MRIETEAIRGWRTCARDRRAHGDCPGYESEEIDIIREVRTTTFGDMGHDTSDPYWPITSHTHERLQPAAEADRQCPHCGAATSISLEPRHEFPRLSEHSPNELVRRAELERARDQRSADALSADERAAVALEKLAASQGFSRGDMAGVMRELLEEHQRLAAEQIAALRAELAGNGHGGDVSTLDPAANGELATSDPPPTPPRPRKRT